MPMCRAQDLATGWTVKPPRTQQRIHDCTNTVRQVRYGHDDGSTKAHGASFAANITNDHANNALK